MWSLPTLGTFLIGTYLTLWLFLRRFRGHHDPSSLRLVAHPRMKSAEA